MLSPISINIIIQGAFMLLVLIITLHIKLSKSLINQLDLGIIKNITCIAWGISCLTTDWSFHWVFNITLCASSVFMILSAVGILTIGLKKRRHHMLAKEINDIQALIDKTEEMENKNKNIN